MTKSELCRLFYIKKEIRAYKEKLEKMEATDGVGSPTLTAAPAHSGKISNIAAQIAIERADIKTQLAKLELAAAKKEKEILEFIQTIDDPYYRTIIIYRHIELLQWPQIADKMGTTEGSVRKAHDRFLLKNENMSHMSV